MTARLRGPSGLPFVGNLLQFRNDPLAFLRQTAQYGDIVPINLLGPTFLLNHPDYARRVLVDNGDNYTKGPLNRRLKPFLGEGLLTGNGSWWRYQRRLVQPFFTREKMESLVPRILQVITEVTDSWRRHAAEKRPINIQEEMIRVTSAVIGEIVLGAPVTRDTQRLSSAVALGLKIAQRRVGSLFPLPLWIPTAQNIRARHSLSVLKGIIDDHIHDHRQSSQVKPDLLSVLLTCEDEGGQTMSKQQIYDQIITVLLAGYETTATAMSWFWYLLAHHTDVQEQAIEEAASAQTVMATHGGLPFITACFQETMRLYPPSWLLHRQAVGKDIIGGELINRGIALLVSPYLLHRDPRYWDEPENFKPKRFLLGQDLHQKYVYIPFGAGHRYCVGSQLAMLEAQLIASSILCRFRLRRVDGSPIRPEAAVTLRPSHPIYLFIETR